MERIKCGCNVVLTGGGQWRISYCPLHKSAPDLYEALKDLLDGLGNPMEITPYELVEKASQALSKVEGHNE